MTRFEATMSHLQLAKLLDDLLRELDASAVTTAAGVTQCITTYLNQKTAAYYLSVVSEFERFAATVASSGFSTGYCAFFAVPLADGNCVELFPGGSCYQVTTHNVAAFLNLYKAYKDNQPYRYTDFPMLLPLKPSLSLQSDFSVIVSLLENEISKWKLSDASWEAMHLTYECPRHGVLIKLEGSGDTVQHADIQKYVDLVKRDLKSTVLSQVRAAAPPLHSTKNDNEASVSEKERFHHYQNFESYLRSIYWCDKGKSATPMTAAQFRELDVYYCVPVLGKIVDLVPNGHNIAVPLSEKDAYCQMAAEKLGIKLDAPSEGLPALPASTSAAQGLMSPKNYQFDIFAPSKKKTDTLANSLTKILTPDEIRFHFQTVLRQLALGKWSEPDIKGLGLFYEVPHNNHLIPLVPNGQEIPVTLSNKDDFVLRAMEALNLKGVFMSDVPLPKKDPEEDKVLGLFSPSHFEADLFAPYVPSTQVQVTPAVPEPNDSITTDEKNFWDMFDVLQNGFQPTNLPFMKLKFVLKFPNGRIVELKEGGHNILVTEENLDEFIATVKQKREAIHLAFMYSDSDLDPILRFPKEKAAEINDCELRNEDLQKCPLFALIDGLAGSDFSPEEFDRMKLMYCIPLSVGGGAVYDLVPDGRNLAVTSSHRDDFVARVLYEKERLLKKLSPGYSASSASSVNSNKQSAHREEMAMLKRSISSIPLTAKQVQHLAEFRENVRVLGETQLDEEAWNEFRLAWCIRCDDLKFDIVPDGTTKPVVFSQKDEFVRKCLQKCDSILEDQRDRENVAVPPASSDAMGLFSPTHFEQDLFAPAQHITTKTNFGSSLTVHPTPPPIASLATASPNRPTVPPPPVTPPAGGTNVSGETLQQFLEKSNCSNALTGLTANDVASVDDLLELTDDDISQIVTSVLIRRRLIDAIARRRNATK